jgi:gluconate 2-dehydrogenase gamma chain
MTPNPIDRRDFLASSAQALGGAGLLRLTPLLALAQACARDTQSDAVLATFTEREAADFEAFAARIIPTDDTPGAREAGAVRFADRALDTLLSDLLPIVRGGLTSLAEGATTAPSAASGATFAALPETEQDALIARIEVDDPSFFAFSRSLIVLSLVSHPDHGGNRDHLGWTLMGFEERFAYQPPFGAYDRDEHGATGSAP